jgi:periplasmic divalent cation tolerance protein
MNPRMQRAMSQGTRLAAPRSLLRMSMPRFLQVTVAADSEQTAVHLARSVVAARLAAGAHVHGPVGSVFWHLGELGEGQEWFVMLKTTAARYLELESHLLAEHPWDNPEISAVPLAAGSAAYLAWLERTVGPESDF